MALRQAWLALALAAAVLVVCAWRVFVGSTRGERPLDALWIAHTDRIRCLPRFGALARRRVRWLGVELACVVLVLVGALALVARPTAVAGDSREMRARDVMLCLDVSPSMVVADQVVIESFRNLVDRLGGERIGLVAWNSSAVLAFPLTDDYVFVEEQLASLSAALGDAEEGIDDRDGRSVLEAANIGAGSSLIGDGLMSCLTRFDQRAEERPRTVVFATDNQLAGAPLFTLDEAGEHAVDEAVLVFGISPGLPDGAQRDEFAEVVEATGGSLLDITSDPAMEARIVRGIEERQRSAIRTMADARSFDVAWPGALLMSVGLAGVLLAVTRGRQ